MDTEAVRTHCMSLPGTTETVQWGNDLVFKVGGKMYAVVALEPAANWLASKCSSESFAELTERQGIVPAPYLARAEWVALQDNSVMKASELKPLLQAAYDLIVAKLPKKTRQFLASA